MPTHMLDGLTYPKRIAAEMACVEGALHYLGSDITPAWLYGGTGHAFAINMRPTACVSSPYVWRKTVYDLAPNLGCRLTGFTVSRKEAGDTFEARQREAWDLVRDAIDRGLPCYADRVSWIPDYALIAGYDDVGYYYVHGQFSGGPTPWQKLGTEDIEVIDVWRAERCEPRPDVEVVTAALDTILRRASTPDGWATSDGQQSGPAAFDLWAEEVDSGRALLDSHGYNAHFWHEYRAMAVAFLEEARTRLPRSCHAALDEAIAHYAVVRDRLAEVRDRAPFRDDVNWTDTLRSPEIAALIRDAGAAERLGLSELAGALSALKGPSEADARGGST